MEFGPRTKSSNETPESMCICMSDDSWALLSGIIGLPSVLLFGNK